MRASRKGTENYDIDEISEFGTTVTQPSFLAKFVNIGDKS